MWALSRDLATTIAFKLRNELRVAVAKKQKTRVKAADSLNEGGGVDCVSYADV